MRTLYSHPDGGGSGVQRTSEPYPSPGRKVSLCAVLRTRSRLTGAHGRQRIRRFMRKGSMTVEAAAALPLFLLTVAALICMMEMYGAYAVRVVRRQEQAETAGAYASIAGDYAPEAIDLPEVFVYTPRFAPAALPRVRLALRARVRPWTGRAEEEAAATQEHTTDEMVYVTEHASVYHTHAGCTYLDLSVRSVGGAQLNGLRNTYGEKYHACEKCVGSGGKNAIVYITGDGTHYHNAAECSGLKRSVRLVKKSETGGMHVCSRCAQAAMQGSEAA